MGYRNNLWSGQYQPLRIVARMAGPIAMLPHEGLPLDGLLEYAAFRLGWPPVLQYGDPATGRRHLPRVTSADPANFVLPVKRVGHKCDPDWYWSASWAFFPDGYEVDRTHWNRRFDGGDASLGRHLTFLGRRGTFNVAAGRYKGYHMPMALVVAPTVEWFALGAADGIARLLQVLTHLGKKRSQGFGEVLSWSVWPHGADWSCWRDGRPMRALPDTPGEFCREHCGLRPPYWHQSRRRLCVVPERESATAPKAEKAKWGG